MLFLCQVVEWKREKDTDFISEPTQNLWISLITSVIFLLHLTTWQKIWGIHSQEIASCHTDLDGLGHSIFMKIEAFALLFHQFLLKRIIIKLLTSLKIVFFS